MDHLLCLVCSTPITSIHLGMDICRACSSFFKRAIKAGIQYPCRQSTRQCPVSRETKMCRRCRFDKCLALGIVFNGPKRLRAKPSIPLLQRITEEFKALIERRRLKELEFIETCQNTLIIPHPKEAIYAVDANSSADIHLIEAVESIIFFENSFPSLKKICKFEKLSKLSIIVNYCLTKKVWGRINKKVMTSVITCYDPNIPFDFYYPDDDGNKDFFKSSMLSLSDEHVEMFSPLFERAQISETEFIALAALALTEHDTKISEETHQIMDGIRVELLENLQTYYQKEMGLSDFSIRLGNLMTLNHVIQECQALYKVVIQYCSTFFDTYMTKKLLKAMSFEA